MYTEMQFDTPTIFTPAAAVTTEQLFAAWPHKYVFGFIIRVRDMGTATYVRIGTEAAQEYSLIAAGQTLRWSGFPGQVTDMAKLYVYSDTDDAVIEIFAEYAPVLGNTEVNKVEGRGK
jgi:hypothetical protein